MKKNLLILLSLFFLFQTISFADCWHINEIADIEFEELDNSIILSFKDDVSCKKLENTKIKVLNNTLITDSNGYARLPLELLEKINNGFFPLTAEKDGYITLKSSLNFMVGTLFHK